MIDDEKFFFSSVPKICQMCKKWNTALAICKKCRKIKVEALKGKIDQLKKKKENRKNIGKNVDLKELKKEKTDSNTDKKLVSKGSNNVKNKKPELNKKEP